MTIATELKALVQGLTRPELLAHLKPLKIAMKETKEVYMLNFKDDADFSNPVVRQANGTIFEKKTNKLLHFTFEKCYDNGHDSKDLYPSIIKQSDILYAESFNEGSLMKLYFYNHEWRLATSKCILADKSYWTSSKSFEELFNESVDPEFWESLDTKYCYSYIFQHPELRMFKNVQEPKIILVTKVNLETEELFSNDVFAIKDYKHPEFNGDMDSYLNNKENVLVVLKNGARIKCLNLDYTIIKSLINSNANLFLVYLANLNNRANKEILKGLYPTDMFDILDQKIAQTVEEIYDLYVKNYIYKENNEIPENYKQTLRQLHGKYKATKVNIVRADVMMVLQNIKPISVAYVINHKINKP